MHRLKELIVLCALYATALSAAGQDRVLDMAPGVQWSSKSYTDALQESISQYKLLFVYEGILGSASSREFRSNVVNSPTVAAYIRWHGIAIRQPGCNKIEVYQNGRLVRVIKGSSLGPPTPLKFLLEMDMCMDGLKVKDPVWVEAHNLHNPPPVPPPMPDDYFKSDDGLGEAVLDPRPEDGPVDLWARLDSARNAVKVGNLHYATGMYTWLWEKAAQFDPAFGPARRGALAAEIADLAVQRPAARERFARIRDAHSARMLWADYDEIAEWSVLSGMVQDDELTLDWFALFTVDENEAAMLPRSDKIAYDLLLQRERPADAFELGRDPVARVNRIAALASGPMPRLVQHEDWPRLRDFARSYLVDEACRLHAACLKTGRDNDAWRICDILLKSNDTPLTRRQIATTALVAGVPRQSHITLIGDADADLSRRLAAAATGSAGTTTAVGAGRPAEAHAP